MFRLRRVTSSINNRQRKKRNQKEKAPIVVEKPKAAETETDSSDATLASSGTDGSTTSTHSRSSDEDDATTRHLAALEGELWKLDSKSRAIIDQVQMIAPEAINDESLRLQFLRCEKYDASKAAKRFAKYWKTYIELFGDNGGAFRPFTQHETLNKPDDKEALEKGYARIIPGKENVIIFDPSRTPKKIRLDSIMRSVSYVYAKALEASDKIRDEGAIMICDFDRIGCSDRGVMTRLCFFSNEEIPFPLKSVLIINPPPGAVHIIGMIKLGFDAQSRDRIQIIRRKQTDEILPLLAGVTLGELTFDYADWLKTMREEESRKRS